MIEQARVTAIVTCGGRATRMGGEAKYLLQVDRDRRVIDLAIDPITTNPELTTTHIILASGAHRQEVDEYASTLRERHPNIRFDTSYSPPNGQAEAIGRAIAEYGVSGHVILVNADEIVADIDLGSIIERHISNLHAITRVVSLNSNDGTSIIGVDEEDRATQIGNTNFYPYATGIIILSPFALRIASQCSTDKEFWTVMETTHQIHVAICEESLNVNSPTDLQEARRRYSH